MKFCTNMDRKRAREIYRAIQNPFFTLVLGVLFIFYAVQIFSPEVSSKFICKILVLLVLIIVCFIARDLYYIERICPKSGKSRNGQYMQTVILSILVDTFISKISFPMQPGPEIGSISDA